MPTERELMLRRAAIKAAYGEMVPARECPDPIDPSAAEERYQRAIECFEDGKQCRGWDHIEAGDRFCGEARLTVGFTQESTPGDYYDQKRQDAEKALEAGDQEALGRARYVGD